MWRSIRLAAMRPEDASGLAVFRVLFGLLVAWSALRYELNGWIDQLYVQPRFYFHYWGAAWAAPLSPAGMHALFGVMVVAGVCIALGLAYRLACATYFVAFTYVELIDVSNYLNHYYLVSLLALLAVFLPLHARGSIDAWLRPSIARRTLPAWVPWLLRFQVGIVYFFAAIAKATPDWLLHGQPMAIWLAARTDLPLVGPWLDAPGMALAASWAGFLYDLTIPLWLSMRRTRPLAYVAVIAFHVAVGALFPIGMFPVIMIVATTVFFDGDWPTRLARRRVLDVSPAPKARLATPIALVIAAWMLVQIVLPLRAFAYGGNVQWHEQGMRWSWRVLPREKNGAVTFRVTARGWSHERLVSPDRYLTPTQEREMSTQPDLIAQLARRVRADVERQGHRDVVVRVDAFVSLNGRPMARMIDPDVDLSRVALSLAPAPWILDAPEGPPPTLTSRASLRADAR